MHRHQATTRGLLAVGILVLALCSHRGESRNSQAGEWKTQKQVEKEVSSATFRVALVIYTSSGKKLAGSHPESVFLEAAVALKTFQVPSYKVNCGKTPSVEQCKDVSAKTPAIYIYHARKHTLVSAEEYASRSALTSRVAQVLLTNFQMGSGKLLQVVSTEAQLQRVYKWNEKVAVMALQDWFDEDHHVYLEALFYFLSGRHGYKIKMVLTNNLKLCSVAECRQSQHKGILWVKHSKGEAHPDHFIVYRGKVAHQGLLAFFFGSVLPAMLTSEELGEDDGRLMKEIDVHGDFGLTVALLACTNQKLKVAVKLLFSDMNAKYAGTVVGAHINIRDSSTVALIPEVQSYLQAAETDQSIRRPLIIIRPGAKDGNRPEPGVIMDITLENIERAYQQLIPQGRGHKTHGTRPSAPATPPVIPDGDIGTYSSLGEEDDDAGLVGSGGGPPEFDAQSVTPPTETDTDVGDTDSAFKIWHDGEEIEPGEDRDEDDVSYLSATTARLTHLLRISPASYVPFARREEVPKLYERAPVIVVFYHSPYTASSRVFRVVFSDVAKHFQNRTKDVAFVAIDCTQLPEVCAARSILRLPGVAFLTRKPGSKDHKHSVYRDFMDFPALTKAVQLYLEPTIHKLSTRKQLVDLMKRHYGTLGETVAVGLFSSSHLSEYSTFAAVAGKWKGRFLFVSATGDLFNHLVEKHSATVPSVLLIKPRDLAQPHVLYTGKISETGLRKFFKTKTAQLMGQLTPANGGMAFSDGRTLVVYIGRTNLPKNASTSKTLPLWQQLLNTVMVVALEEEFNERFLFLWMRKDVQGMKQIQSTLMLDEGTGIVAILDRKAQAVFEFSGDATEKRIRSFLRDYLESQLYPSGHFTLYSWSQSQFTFDFLSKAKERTAWEKQAKNNQQEQQEEVESSTEPFARQGRVRASALTDQELQEGDEIKLDASLPDKESGASKKPSTESAEHGHDEL